MLLFRYFSVTREVLSSKLVCVCSPGCKEGMLIVLRVIYSCY